MNRTHEHSGFHGLDMALLLMGFGLAFLLGFGSWLGLPLLALGAWDLYQGRPKE